MVTGDNMIDIHCHLEYMPNPEQIIAEARQKMKAIITSVADIKHKDQILALQSKNPDFVFVSLGLHPDRISKYRDDEINDYLNFIKANKNKIVAIGECGLDYLQVKKENRKRAGDFFFQFIELAKELKLPLVVHSRNEPGDNSCTNDILRILKNQNAKSVVLHCFSGSESNLKYALEQDYWISFATIICKSEKHQRLAEKTPVENMLLETDSPWLHPSSKELINRPWMIFESARVIAGIKGTTAEKILQQTTENAKKVFNLRF
jgi:TatD DNase family protein